MVDFENVQRTFRIRISVGERVKPCTQNDILAYAAPNPEGEFILGVSTPCGYESSQVRGQRRGLILTWIGLQCRSILFADDVKCQRVIENLRIIQELMCCTAHRNTLCR